jgi:hypothetical protein
MSKRCAPRQRRNAQFLRRSRFAICRPLDQEKADAIRHSPIRVCPHARERWLANHGSQGPRRIAREALLLFKR